MLEVTVALLLIAYGWMVYEFANAPVVRDEE
jgi:hypothetical protein